MGKPEQTLDNQGFWTNPSVLVFASGRDPVEAISDLTQHVVLAAVDSGWEGPPFDPFELANLLGVPLAARQGLSDARTVPHEGAVLQRTEELANLLGAEPPPVLIEYNPTRPRGRLRYSLAHEIAHGFFPDVAQMVRNRTGTGAVAEGADGDDWQLELLCNIAAGELLMPTDTLSGLDDQPLDIDMLMAVRAHFDVSTEALLRRVATQTSQPVAVFASSRVNGNEENSSFRVEYAVPSRTYKSPFQHGQRLQADSVLAECAAIGYTARGNLDASEEGGQLAAQCVGLPPYPSQRLPRVAGFVGAPMMEGSSGSSITYLVGDVTDPRGAGPKIIAHVVNNQASRWARHSVGGDLARRYPDAPVFFTTWVMDDPSMLALGEVHLLPVNNELTIASMVAQVGYGPSEDMRLRYEALETCLHTVAAEARRTGASVHMPRIGTGQGGGRWPVIREILDRTMSRHGIPVTIYSPPGQRTDDNGDGITLRSIERRHPRRPSPLHPSSPGRGRQG
jgi:O-acetyl-ADP-ribose deacetylase (regulator of RNase III)